MAFGSHNAPCLYGSECLTLNSRCQAGFCLCVDGFYFKQGLCGKSVNLLCQLRQSSLIVVTSGLAGCYIQFVMISANVCLC